MHLLPWLPCACDTNEEYDRLFPPLLTASHPTQFLDKWNSYLQDQFPQLAVSAREDYPDGSHTQWPLTGTFTQVLATDGIPWACPLNMFME